MARKNEKKSALKTLSDNDLGTVVGGKGHANHSDFAIVKRLDIATPKLHEN